MYRKVEDNKTICHRLYIDSRSLWSIKHQESVQNQLNNTGISSWIKKKKWSGIECIQSHEVVAKNTKKGPTPCIKIKFKEYQNTKEIYWSLVLLT